ncbi:receptor-type tyrosine-protein phosphatase C isoform X2 [Pseudoliparis swirei]|uniref:receptor-type tyrosine-protein phosphatase C isoform X2 n=1 Tax=Pseudoliparis swirei TaxID=2059687 RepID=UPI0024BE594A|nr:receptor-type tyrosine-protein phosphatase C isoform X2 [Pseudoliparis swirei]
MVRSRTRAELQDMAALCGLKVLLLWAGIFTSANCEKTTASPTDVPLLPPRTSTNSTPRTVTTASVTVTTASVTPSDLSTAAHTPPLTSHPPKDPRGTAAAAPPASSSPKTTNANEGPTSPPISTSNTTVTPPPEAPTQAPPPQQCSYSVTPVKFGLRVDNGSSSVSFREKGGVGRPFVQFSNQSSHEITRLKPCTKYEFRGTFIDGAGNKSPCSTDATTLEMSRDDVTDGGCMHGYVCYRSGWDLSSSLPESCPNDAEQLCIKPGFHDICTTFTTTFISEACRSSFNLSSRVPADFLDPSEIKLKFPDELPAVIQAELPPNCKNLTVDYTCWRVDAADGLKLQELEPFTNYSCSAQIRDHDDDIILNHTAAVRFRVDCDLTINITGETSTNTSIGWSWTSSSRRCSRVLPELKKKLSHDCSCRKKHGGSVSAQANPPQGRCNVSGLEPYTDYNCEVLSRYDGRETMNRSQRFSHRTKPGIPDPVPSLTVSVPEHNVIVVSCSYRKRLNGPQKTFLASLDGVKMAEKKDCSFEFRDLSYSTDYRVAVTVCNGNFCSEPKRETVSTSYNDKAVIGLLVFLIILTSVALLLVVYKIYILKRRKSHDLGENMMLISTANDEQNLMPVEPIAADFLLEAYKRKLADEGRLFLAEFQSIPRIFSRYSVKEAKKSCNVSKNRYVDILPYDYNRVQLTTGNGEAGCEYINASSIDGYKESKKYIAAQGPKDETVSDFWRMIWEQQSSIIVMVTRCEEGNRIKCAQYWPSPERETEIFEEFVVKLSSEDRCPDYTVRRLSLANKKEKSSEREVTHIQFMSWPDHGVPGEPHLLLKLRRRVNAFKNFFSGPIVIHCSAGVGRTGTYIGIDAMMEALEAEGAVDIYGYIVRLRRQRCLMVQVEAQYILIHQALLEHNQFGETELSVPELHAAVSALQLRHSGNEPTAMEEEFERLPVYKNWRTFNAGLTEENRKKNRSSSVLPYDYNRVLLKVDEGRSHDTDPSEEDEEESSDEETEEATTYINASHIDGYWGPHTFLAAQTPLPDTAADFWSMIHQERASTIVMLGEEESDGVYWGEDKKTFGDFEVEVKSSDASPTVVSRNMLLRHVKRKDVRPVKQFQLRRWASGDLPERALHLTDMIRDVKRSQSESSTPIVVHCRDGSSRSGLFCALCNLLDSADTEKLLDVFQVVKTLRKERQGMISNPEQYQFLYEALEGVYPVQNGDVKSTPASAGDSVQMVNETRAAEQPASTTADSQQGAAESAPLVADGGKEDNKEENESKRASLKDTEGVTVTAEV